MKYGDSYPYEVAEFTVNGMATDEEQMLVIVPKKYRAEFDGKNFADAHHLSMALMFADCAYEARTFNKPWLVRQHEVSLRATLEQCI